MALLPLVTSLLVSSLRLDLTPTKLDGNPLHLISSTKNLTLALLVGGPTLVADQIAVADIEEGDTLSLMIRCVSSTSLQLATSESSAVVQAPSICANATGLYIEEAALFGCVTNVYQGSTLLLQRICSNGGTPPSTTTTTTMAPDDHTPVFVNEPLKVSEGAAMAIQWNNVYMLPDQSRANISDRDVVFSVVSGPHHGVLLLKGEPSFTFTYEALLARDVIYKHDGSETTEDSLQFQVEMSSPSYDFPWLESTTYTLKMQIDPVNDPPELSLERGREVLQVPARASRTLLPGDVVLSDTDNTPDEVRIHVVDKRGVLVTVNNRTADEFTQRQLINKQVSIMDEGTMAEGHLELVARDREARSMVVTLKVSSVKVDVRLGVNTGVRLLHHESVLITQQNLSFTAIPSSSPISFVVVDLPDNGVIECAGSGGHFSICSQFTQEMINQEMVRYRHTDTARPSADSFSFQVESGDFVSIVHNLRVMFIPLNIKVFTREVFMLNATDHRTLTRSSLFAWTFPKSFSPDNISYHIVEPPKFGILSKKVSTKNRRLGVSSNFTQDDIDRELLSYKLHFPQFSVVNDFLLFRVISPVTSEILRFEVVIIPSPSSIQLTNRTIIVKEGGSALISSDFLSLTTSDERHFVFVVGSAPSFGSFQVRGVNGNRTLAAGGNFTTTMVSEQRVFYQHRGEEHRSDRAYMVAESAHRLGTRFPFWMSFSVILENDNPPTLHGSDILPMLEKGERVLRRYLLDWRDDDLDSPSLVFSFIAPLKDVVLLSTRVPHIPMNSFDQDDLDNGQVMIQHLGQAKNITLRYTVSDGKYVVDGELKVFASEPFVRVDKALVEYCCSEMDRQEIVVTRHNLSVTTNENDSPRDIRYSTSSLHFYLREKHGRKPVQRFTQEDIDEGLLMYVPHQADNETLTVECAGKKLTVQLRIVVRHFGSSLDLRRSSPLSLSVRSTALLDGDHLMQSDGVTAPAQLVYLITRTPSEGHVVLDSSKDSSTHASAFSQADVDAGRVQYLHTGSSPGKDSFEFNISSPVANKGPYTFYIEIFEHHISLSSPSPIVVTSGSASVISTSSILVTSSGKDDYIFKVEELPKSGWIVKDTWNLDNISSIDWFSGSDLLSRRILFVAPRDLPSSKTDSFTLTSCVDDHTCTPPVIVGVHFAKRNIHSPQVIRNNVLRVMHAESAPITDAHLSCEDVDTPPSNVHYLISRPSNGIVVRLSDPSLPVYNFSQSEIDEGLIVFHKTANSSGSGGFSFLLTDGVHQVGPEWFSIESWGKFSIALEANSRLMAAPQATTLISVDVLRANIASIPPQEILFSITKPPKRGKVLVNGVPSHKFRQHDINRRLVMYSSVNTTQLEWSAKDAFHFIVTVNDSGRPVDHEYRFRVVSTYAALPDELMKRYVSSSLLVLSQGGSAAFNVSHLSLDRLAAAVSREVLLIQVAKHPRLGEIEMANSKGIISWNEFERGMPIIYRHTGDSSAREDEVSFYVYPASERTRRSSRLVVVVPIRLTPVRDALVTVDHFPSSLSVVSGGVTSLPPSLFKTSHPNVPPLSILYEVVQTPRSKMSIRVDGRVKHSFSQEELNNGVVSMWHTASPSALSFDVAVFSIEGHNRALLIKIRPLDMALENHTTITYPQGQNYVVLNSSFLGAFSTGDRSKIMYKITRPPENGTFYWVAGEKEAKIFTQKDIDQGRILYAQINMEAYQDQFEFSMGDEDREALRMTSDIMVTSLVDVQPIIVESDTVVQITASQLNASRLEGKTPRFMSMNKLKYGALSLEGQTVNDTNIFFTFIDVQRGRVSYRSFNVVNEVTELVELEVRADSIQPAIVTLAITILPGDADTSPTFSDDMPLIEGGLISTTLPPPDAAIPQVSPINDYYLILILLGILVLTVMILVCRLRSSAKKHKASESPKTSITEKEPPARRPDILGSTVFATITRAEEEFRPAMTSFDRRPSASLAHTPVPLGQKRAQASLDYAGMTADAPPPLSLFQQVYSENDEIFDV